MPVAPGPSRRSVFLIVALSAVAAIIFVSAFRSQPAGVRHPNNILPSSPESNILLADHLNIDHETLTGAPIMPKLPNATAKAELGRAAWLILHTMMSRYPEVPTQDEKTALQSYVHLFVRLYPCGECAEHFAQIVEKYPPQVSGRGAAAVWACHVHNEVNKSLGKGVFDCGKIGEFYDCGCAEEEGVEEGGAAATEEARGIEGGEYKKLEMSLDQKEKLTGASGRRFNVDLLPRDPELRLEKEELTAGG